ncbi:MAG: hypothetical protein Q8P18_04935 [Pseudomonadota bacterium]|nr:hypothetical protein [Pseudomonadota bacterium]
MLYASLLALVTPALAEEDAPPASSTPESSEVPPTAPSTETAPPVDMPEATPRKRKFLMEVGFRGRYMDLPDSILDMGYFRNNEEGDLLPDRPHVSAYALGIEFVIKDEKANGIFYVEYLNPLIEAGYWDDKEEPPDHDDGSWMEPDQLGLVMIGANYAYEIKANNWFSFLFGAGIGGAIKIGNMNEWQPGEDPADPEGNNNNVDGACGPAPTTAYQRQEMGCANDGIIETPPVLPYLDVNIGPRFSISDRASIRLEGGVHGFLPYGGGSVGITF